MTQTSLTLKTTETTACSNIHCKHDTHPDFVSEWRRRSGDNSGSGGGGDVVVVVVVMVVVVVVVVAEEEEGEEEEEEEEEEEMSVKTERKHDKQTETSISNFIFKPIN